jgi:hypothetical protein
MLSALKNGHLIKSEITHVYLYFHLTFLSHFRLTHSLSLFLSFFFLPVVTWSIRSRNSDMPTTYILQSIAPNNIDHG